MHTRIQFWTALSPFLLLCCANQMEGERCTTLNGNDDCKPNLVCTRNSELNLPAEAPEDGRCCPSNRQDSIQSVCKGSITPIEPTGPTGSDAAVGD